MNINLDLNSLDYNLARKVGEYFNLGNKEMDTIVDEVLTAVSKWREVAISVKIPSAQIRLMEAAFNV